MGILQIKGIKLITEHQGTGKVTELEKVHDAGVFFFLICSFILMSITFNLTVGPGWHYAKRFQRPYFL
jgi:hypothetical protein